MIQSDNETTGDREPETDAALSGDFPRAGVTRLTDGESDPIGAELKRLYEDAATEPLPQELLDLLAKLEELERADSMQERRG